MDLAVAQMTTEMIEFEKKNHCIAKEIEANAAFLY
jgi:hypothetical protein